VIDLDVPLGQQFLDVAVGPAGTAGDQRIVAATTSGGYQNPA
jgi:hypothetical protein